MATSSTPEQNDVSDNREQYELPPIARGLAWAENIDKHGREVTE